MNLTRSVSSSANVSGTSFTTSIRLAAVAAAASAPANGSERRRFGTVNDAPPKCARSQRLTLEAAPRTGATRAALVSVFLDCICEI